jgi:hypothetical protein
MAARLPRSAGTGRADNEHNVAVFARTGTLHHADFSDEEGRSSHSDRRIEVEWTAPQGRPLLRVIAVRALVLHDRGSRSAAEQHRGRRCAATSTASTHPCTSGLFGP